MRPSLSVGRLATMALSLSLLGSAMQWPRFLPAVDTLVAREDSSSTSQSAETTAVNAEITPTRIAKSSSTTHKGASVTTTNLNTGGIHTGNSTSTTTGATHTIFPAQDPAGSVVMITPAPTYQVTPLYKIGDYITLGWNYTNLQADPTALDVFVSASSASATWTLTQNMTFHTKGAYLWDTADFQAQNAGNPLIVDQYALVIVDADSSITATAEAGYLAPYSGFKFGLYTPRPYQDEDSWQCATCSAALGATERRALGAAVGMSVITVLSFTWFVAGFGGL